MSAAADTDLTREEADALIRSRGFQKLLAVAALIGVLISLLAWCFLELVHQLQEEVFVHLPHAVGYGDGPPTWWPLPVLAIAGVIVAAAIVKLPGQGGHVPVHGLSASGPANPAHLPGILLAAVASLSLGVVLGPEAPLIALGAGSAVYTLRLARREVPQQGAAVVAATGSFAAVSFIFGSPVVAAVLLIEATGLGGHRLRLILMPGLLGAGIGSLVSLGMGSVTGLSSADFALGALPLPEFARPEFTDFLWTIPLAIIAALGAQGIMHLGRQAERVLSPRPFVALPIAGLAIAGLAILFSELTDHSQSFVLFSGEEELPHLISDASTFTVGALLAMIACKGVAYSLSLGGFRGGPAFGALFIGAAAGVVASRLPGFELTPAIAVGMAATFVSVLGLPLSSVVLATLLVSKAGYGAEPLIILAVIVSHIVTLLVGDRAKPATA
jgi:chloride channel protein, CIC family